MSEIERNKPGKINLVEVPGRGAVQSGQSPIENKGGSIDDVAIDLLFTDLIDEAEKGVKAGATIEPTASDLAEIEMANNRPPSASNKSGGTSTGTNEFPAFAFDLPTASEIDEEKLTGFFADQDFENENAGDFDNVQQVTEPLQPTPVVGSAARKIDVKEHINYLWQQSDETISRFDTLKKQFETNIAKYRLINFLALSLALVTLIVAGVMVFIGIELKNQVDSLASISAVNESQSMQPSSPVLEQQVLELQGQISVVQSVLKARQSASKLMVEDLRGIAEQLDEIQALVNPQGGEQNKTDKDMRDSFQPEANGQGSTLKSPWIVSLASFKRESDARKKAQEFIDQGVPVTINRFEVKGKQWFRIIVAGFKSKQESETYAREVTNLLNLESTWVTKIK